MNKQKEPYAQPFRSTKLRRAAAVCVTRLAVLLGQRIGWSIWRLSPNICVKAGSGINLDEVANMEYVRKHTSVPVPKVYCAFKRKGTTYIVMKYIRGEMLWSSWQHCSEETKQSLRCQLRALMLDLRQTPNPSPGQVAARNGSVVYDDRYTEGMIRYFGPFKTPHEFHLWLRQGVEQALPAPPGADPVLMAKLTELIRLQDRREYKTVLTHGDLSSTNIMVKDGKIAAIIDWESAAWLPDYWEFTSAWNVNHLDAF